MNQTALYFILQKLAWAGVMRVQISARRYAVKPQRLGNEHRDMQTNEVFILKHCMP